ncbi:MAG TPA: hypothetical protein VIL85_22890 [Thermomicrobiales bacterium]|jgi:hypothetical protein
MRQSSWFALLLIGLVTLTACGAPTAVSSGALAPRPTATPIKGAATPARAESASGQSFVGRLDNSDALVALVMSEGKVLAYVCDGKQLAAWFSGTMTTSGVDLRAADGTRMTAAVRTAPDGSIAVAPGGMIRTPDGQERAFATANTNTLDKVAGLYQSQSTVGDRELTMGVIALSRNEVRGVLWANETPQPIGAPQFATDRLTAPVPGVGTFTAARVTSVP